MADPSDILITAGVVAILGAAVGGGASFFGQTVPIIASRRRQLLVGAIGIVLVLAGVSLAQKWFFKEPEPPDPKVQYLTKMRWETESEYYFLFDHAGDQFKVTMIFDPKSAFVAAVEIDDGRLRITRAATKNEPSMECTGILPSPPGILKLMCRFGDGENDLVELRPGAVR